MEYPYPIAILLLGKYLREIFACGHQKTPTRLFIPAQIDNCGMFIIQNAKHQWKRNEAELYTTPWTNLRSNNEEKKQITKQYILKNTVLSHLH